MEEKFTEENIEETVENEVNDETTPSTCGCHPSKDGNLKDSPEQQAAEANDKLLRLMAEFDNFKKRSVKEREDLFTFVVCDVINGFLPILDNLDRAIVASDPPVSLDGCHPSKEGNKDNAFFEGVKLVQKQFVDTLTTIGVEEINSVGEEFNPELHNAVMHVEDSEVGANIVVEEFMKGYTYKGRVIRHSMVKSAN